MERTDTELLAAVRAGDAMALEALLTRYAPRIARFTSKMCRHREDARDVAQETLMAAVRGLGDVRDDASVSTWLYTVARSFCIKKRRRSKFAPTAVVATEAGDPLALIRDEAPMPEEAVASRELGDLVTRGLAELDETAREVIVLRDVEGLSAPEVARVLGIGVGAVKSRLHRARVALRAVLEPSVQRPSSSGGEGCPDVVSVFSRYLEGDITGEDCAAMERHVASCPSCAAECDSLKRTLALCRATPHADVPADIQDMVREALRRLPAPPPAR